MPSDFVMLLFVLLSLGAAQAAVRTVREPGPAYNCSYCQPEQIHISFGEQTNDIVVTWTTFNDTGESRVQYGVGSMDLEAVGQRDIFVDGRGQWIHRVTLRDLRFDTRYVYHCGSQYGWSERFSFKTPPRGEDWVVRAAIYGDMGTDNAHSLPYLQDEAERDQFDLILHVGDFAYDMYEQQSRVGDQFMRQIQPLAAVVPYMTCPGNHEENHNFSNYKARFSMPSMRKRSSMFYSFDLGPVHFVAVNTEAYYFLQYGLAPLVSQYEWLKQDLTEANKPNNRHLRPWIVVFGHRPMYCSDLFDDCWNQFLPNRAGLPFVGMGLEPLLAEFGVDVVIWAHEHSYERTWPLYDRRVRNGTGGAYERPRAPVHVVTGSAGCRERTDGFVKVYERPIAPVHVVTGSAGCRERTDGFVKNPPPWSAFRSSDYGFTRFRAHNGTHLYFEQVSVDQKGKVIDSFWIVQDNHGPFKDLL